MREIFFPDISATNLARCLRWHPLGINSWSLSDWNAGLLGEIGEVCEVAEQAMYPTGLPATPRPEHVQVNMADEVADVYCYADLLATSAQLNFLQCIGSSPAFVPTGTIVTAALTMARAGGKLSDVVKKLNRSRDGLGGNKLSDEQLKESLSFYIGLVGQTCALMANRINVPLHLCVSKKFNDVSERMGFPERL